MLLHVTPCDSIISKLETIRRHSGQTHDSWRILGEVQIDLVVCRFDGKARHKGDVLADFHRYLQYKSRQNQKAKICRKLQSSEDMESENCAIKSIKSLPARPQ